MDKGALVTPGHPDSEGRGRRRWGAPTTFIDQVGQGVQVSGGGQWAGAGSICRLRPLAAVLPTTREWAGCLHWAGAGTQPRPQGPLLHLQERVDEAKLGEWPGIGTF